MAVSLPTFSDATVMSVSDMKARMQTVEDWINGGHIVGDLLTDSKIVRDHIYGPDFYGSPAPRVEFASGDVHSRVVPWDWTRASVHDHRIRADGPTGVFHVPVDNMCVTLKLQEASKLWIEASWWAMERGATATYAPVHSTTKVATFSYFENGASHNSTKRRLHGSGSEHRWWAAQNFSLTFQTTLAAGVHSLGIQCKTNTGNLAEGREIYVGARNLQVRVRPSS